LAANDRIAEEARTNSADRTYNRHGIRQVPEGYLSTHFDCLLLGGSNTNDADSSELLNGFVDHSLHITAIVNIANRRNCFNPPSGVVIGLASAACCTV
jgi:hypothetical protein